MTPREFENNASELVRMAMVSKVIGVAEEIDVTVDFAKWAEEIKAGFEPMRVNVNVSFDCDLSDDFVTCIVSVPESPQAYSRSVDFSPDGDKAIANLVHPMNLNKWKVTY